MKRIQSMSVSTKSIKIFATVAVLAFSALFVMTGPAQADLVSTLTYMQPTGTVGPNDSVSVWLKFTLGPNSDPFSTDSSGIISSHSILNGLDLYGGSITNSINGFPNPPYNYVWGPGPGPIQDWNSFWNQFINLSLDAGGSFTYASTTFFPNNGVPVPAGTYTASFYSLSVWGPDQYQETDANGDPLFDTNGNPVMSYQLHNIATTPFDSFSRTV